MRQNWQSLGIAALSDFALDPRMGCDGCEYNSTYYSNLDHTHPTDAGYTIWGSYDLAAVNSLDGSFPPVRTQGSAECGKRVECDDSGTPALIKSPESNLGDGHLSYSVFNGTNWSADRQIQPLGMSGSPSAVLWAGGITVFHEGIDNNGQLWYTYSADGENWGPDTRVPNVGMSESPSAIVF